MSDCDETSEPTGATYLRRSAELLWGSQERPARGPKPGLSLDRIIEAAIAVADAHGVEGLSMRKVAAELGVGTMSLYRYVPGKAELLDLMLDRVSAPDGKVSQAAGKGWRAAMEVSAWGGRRLYLSHPWLLRVNWSRPVFGPNSLAGFHDTVAALDGLGLSGREQIAVILAIDNYVTGAVRQEIMYQQAPAETGISDEEFWSEQYPILEHAMSTGNYPALASLDADSFEDGWEETFEFGLQRMLDGIERLVESRRAAPGS